MKSPIIKVNINVCGEYDVFYYKTSESSEKPFNTMRYVDSIYYSRSNEENYINPEFANYLYNKFKKDYNGEDVYTYNEIQHAKVEFITDVEIEEIDY